MKLTILFYLLYAINAQALTIKIAAIAPEGTSLADCMKNLAKAVDEKTNGAVELKNYYGGVAGDESDVLRKIRVGQMNGGFFTGKTLGDIYEDVRIIELPFNFYRDREKGKMVLDKLAPFFNKGLEKKGFTNLGFFEVGQVYVVSTKKVESLTAMKGIKVWSWDGDELVAALISSIGLVSVPLALPDVLSSLSTGMVDAAYAPPIGIIGLQWQSKIKYLVDFPTAFSIGALLISANDWKKISPTHQKVISELAKQFINEANIQSIKENDASLAQLKKIGVKFINFPKSDYAQAQSIREEVIKRIKGKVVSQKALDKLQEAML